MEKNKATESVITVQSELGPETLAAINDLKLHFDLLRQAIESLPDNVRDFLLHSPAVRAGELDALLASRADD